MELIFESGLLLHVQSTGSLVLYPEEKRSLEDIFAYLTEVMDGRAGRLPAKQLQGTHIQTLVRILQRWPDALRFPGSYSLAGLSVFGLRKLELPLIIIMNHYSPLL